MRNAEALRTRRIGWVDEIRGGRNAVDDDDTVVR